MGEVFLLGLREASPSPPPFACNTAEEVAYTMQTVWISILHQVILVLVQLLVFGLLVWVHRYMPILRKWMEQNLNEKERKVLAMIGKEAFVFAEQAFRDLHGQGKLDQAMKYALSIIDKKGLSYTEDEVRSAIENAVHESNLAS